MSAGNEHFNAMATAWDSNPNLYLVSDSALQAILKIRPIWQTKANTFAVLMKEAGFMTVKPE